jgi:hypothetical protein
MWKTKVWNKNKSNPGSKSILGIYIIDDSYYNPKESSMDNNKQKYKQRVLNY